MPMSDRCIHVSVGDGAQMSLPRPEWLWHMNHVRPEPPRGTQCDDRMLAVGILGSYLYLVEECTKDEAWRRIKILRAAMNDIRGENSDYGGATPTEASARMEEKDFGP